MISSEAVVLPTLEPPRADDCAILRDGFGLFRPIDCTGTGAILLKLNSPRYRPGSRWGTFHAHDTDTT